MAETPSGRPSALLLVGPTGAGKSPLGQLLEARGCGGRRWVHFDFGAALRTAAAGQHLGLLAPAEVAFLRRVLDTGALLEDEHFPIAQKILLRFLAEREHGAAVVLNGLPRHSGQAEAIDRLVAIELVVELRCSAEVVRARLRHDPGGDRQGRVDADLGLVSRKLAIFAARTSPLVAHYCARGARTVTIDVTAAMTPDAMWRLLAEQAFSP